MNELRCAICGEPVDTRSRFTYERITGWHRPGRAGGSDIVNRRKLGEFAHPVCVDRERDGVHHAQEALL